MAECIATFFSCRCSRTDEHEVHACTHESAMTSDGRCHGQWKVRDGCVVVVQYPTGAWTEEEAARDLARWKATGQLVETRDA